MTSPFPEGLSVFLPCYNEEGNVERVVRDALETLPSRVPDFEVIVVDDGSRDRTAAIAEELAREDPRVRLVRHPKNRGYGAALQTGIQSATRGHVFYTDGDYQFRMADIDRLLPLVPEADIVSAWRIERRDPMGRKLLSQSFGFLCRVLLRLRVRDVNCAFKIYRREFVQDLDLRCGGAVIDAEILFRAKKRGARIVQVGVPHHPREVGSQTGGNPRVVLRAFKEVVLVALGIW